MKFLSVCSGIEAASVAWRPLGWSAVAFSEIEPFPCAVLAHHYPDTPNWGDMTKYKEWPDVPISLLCGGTPCQSFSVAGLRTGLADPRGNLMLTFGAIAAKYRPRWLVWENVPGVLSSSGGRDFGSFLGLLGELGYGFAYRVLDAQFFGVPQRRRRVFVVGCLGDWRSAAAVLFERHSLSGNPAPSRKVGKRPAPTLSARTKGGGGLGTDFDCDGGLVQTFALQHAQIGRKYDAGPQGKGWQADVAFTQDSRNAADAVAIVPAIAQCHTRGGQQRLDPETETLIPTIGGGFDVAHALTGEGFDASEDGTGRGTPLVPVKLYQDSEFGVGEYDTAGSLRAGRIPEHQMIIEPVSVALRGREGGAVAELGDDQAFALRASTGGGDKPHVLEPMSFPWQQGGTLGMSGTLVKNQTMAIQQAMQVRRLTPEECEALQGFSRSYTQVPYRGKPAADGPRYKALGNSWAVPCARWIGQRIEAVEAISALKEAA